MADRSPRSALAALIDRLADRRAAPDILQPADLFFDLAGEDIGRRLILTNGTDGAPLCLRPEFTLPVARDYLDAPRAGLRDAIGYFGPVFRQRDGEPAEFDQAGLEVLGTSDSEDDFERVLDFALESAALFGIKAPAIHLGSVDLFEAFLAGLDMPDVWRPRIRDRLGNRDAMQTLISRLRDPEPPGRDPKLPTRLFDLTEHVAAQIAQAGLPSTTSRGAEEIAERYLEKLALAEAQVPGATLAALEDFFAISGAMPEALEAIESLAGETDVDLSAPLERLARRALLLDEHDGAGAVSFDTSFAPRLDYYTGHVFELLGPGSTVLASGGQYGRLLGRLGSVVDLDAVGCAVWVDRLEAAQ